MNTYKSSSRNSLAITPGRKSLLWVLLKRSSWNSPKSSPGWTCPVRCRKALHKNKTQTPIWNATMTSLFDFFFQELQLDCLRDVLLRLLHAGNRPLIFFKSSPRVPFNNAPRVSSGKPAECFLKVLQDLYQWILLKLFLEYLVEILQKFDLEIFFLSRKSPRVLCRNSQGVFSWNLSWVSPRNPPSNSSEILPRARCLWYKHIEKNQYG